MRLLVLVKSSVAARDAKKHDAVRTQWQSYRLNVDTRFFFTSNKQGIAFKDEIQIEARDHEDAFMVRDMLRWSRNKLFDYVFIHDIDSIIDVKTVVTTKLSEDYIGHFSWPLGERRPFEYTKDGVTSFIPNAHAYALGKMGYFLSNVAVHGLVDRSPSVPYADIWVGQVVGDEQALGLATSRDLSEENNVQKA